MTKWSSAEGRILTRDHGKPWHDYAPLLISGLCFLLVVLGGCQRSRYDQLMDTSWRFDHMLVDGEISTAIAASPRIEFGPPPQLEGYDGCNAFGGEYVVTNDEHLSIEVTRITKMWCGKLDLETGKKTSIGDELFREVLVNSARYRIQDAQLWIYSADSATALVFRRIGSPDQ